MPYTGSDIYNDAFFEGIMTLDQYSHYRQGGFSETMLDQHIQNKLSENYQKEYKKKIFSCIFRLEDIESLATDQKESEKKEISVLPCPEGTKWDQIKITLISDIAVKIETPLGTNNFSYHQLDLWDKRTADRRPGVLWNLLKLFCKNQGYIKPSNSKYDPRLPDTVKRFNKHMKKLFGIKDSIFKGHYKAQKGYETKVFMSDRTIVID